LKFNKVLWRAAIVCAIALVNPFSTAVGGYLKDGNAGSDCTWMPVDFRLNDLLNRSNNSESIPNARIGIKYTNYFCGLSQTKGFSRSTTFDATGTMYLLLAETTHPTVEISRIKICDHPSMVTVSYKYLRSEVFGVNRWMGFDDLSSSNIVNILDKTQYARLNINNSVGYGAISVKFIPDTSTEVLSSGVEPTGLGHGDIVNYYRLASDQRWTAIGNLPPICPDNTPTGVQRATMAVADAYASSAKKMVAARRIRRIRTSPQVRILRPPVGVANSLPSVTDDYAVAGSRVKAPLPLLPRYCLGI
jgi:hypothetical protein